MVSPTGFHILNPLEVLISYIWIHSSRNCLGPSVRRVFKHFYSPLFCYPFPCATHLLVHLPRLSQKESCSICLCLPLFPSLSCSLESTLTHPAETAWQGSPTPHDHMPCLPENMCCSSVIIIWEWTSVHSQTCSGSKINHGLCVPDSTEWSWYIKTERASDGFDRYKIIGKERLQDLSSNHDAFKREQWCY